MCLKLHMLSKYQLLIYMCTKEIYMNRQSRELSEKSLKAKNPFCKNRIRWILLKKYTHILYSTQFHPPGKRREILCLLQNTIGRQGHLLTQRCT